MRDSADYVRVVREPDSASVLYNVLEFYLNGDTKLVGKSSVIDPPKYEGMVVSYYRNGKRREIANYKNGLPAGSQFEFYPNGKPYIVKKYPDSVDVYTNRKGNFLIIGETDSLGAQMLADGNGYYKEYDDHFKNVTDEGPVKNGKPDGKWTGYDEGMKVHFFEVYDNGKLVSGISTGEKGDTVKYSGARDVEPQFKGGLPAFYKYISRSVNYPDFERSHGIQGKVILSFVVERDGKITSIKVLNAVSVNIDAEAVRVLQASPKWSPGSRLGRNVRVQYSIPMNFSLRN